MNSQIIITIECDPPLPDGTKLTVKHHIQDIETGAVEKSLTRKAVRPQKDKRWLDSYEDAAEFSGFSVHQLKRMVVRREIGVNKRAHNKVVFDALELEEYRKKFWVKKLR